MSDDVRTVQEHCDDVRRKADRLLQAKTVREHADDQLDAASARRDAHERLDMAEEWLAEIDRMYAESLSDFDELRRLAFKERDEAKAALDALPYRVAS